MVVGGTTLRKMEGKLTSAQKKERKGKSKKRKGEESHPEDTERRRDIKEKLFLKKWTACQPKGENRRVNKHWL